MKSYEDIFNHRANAYHRAMEEFPSARDLEFKLLFNGISTDSARKVVDIPSGGGYLKRYLNDPVEIHELEFSEGFVDQSEPQSVRKVDQQSPELTEGYYDLGVCLAALHHVEPKQPFIQAVLKGIKPGGFLCVADVLRESKEAIFLDGFVARHNSTGHEGSYLPDSESTLSELGGGIGRLIRHEYLPCPWEFTNDESLVQFVKNLFGLSGLTSESLWDELETQIGITRGEGTVALNWGLLYFSFER